MVRRLIVTLRNMSSWQGLTHIKKCSLSFRKVGKNRCNFRASMKRNVVLSYF
ncbi:hypothetical protein BVRB_9g211620 [Beta vulgaris subsp. vulgaris]|nr:hypothetical protein BVRB_9g211620 [Beta vulgaris subsp. vulgaris]